MAITRSGSSSPTPNSKMEASSSILRIRGISMKSKADKGKKVRSKISGTSEKKRSAPDGSNLKNLEKRSKRIKVSDQQPTNMEHVVAEYMSGYKMHCNTCWLNVDHVLIPIYMEEEKHWVLGHLSLRDRCIYVYNSLHSENIDERVEKALEPFCVLLPYFLSLIGFFDSQKDIDFESGSYAKRDVSHPLQIVIVGGLPIQTNNFDSGLFILTFAEYLIHGKAAEIPRNNFDDYIFRNRLSRKCDGLRERPREREREERERLRYLKLGSQGLLRAEESRSSELDERRKSEPSCEQMGITAKEERFLFSLGQWRRWR
ncbi:Ulp1 protease family, C-terminal catalytic domain containing protein [Trema orientale]|uniref:Ulp1 protease family, C-terminal catalytic domain containing protein n=1 Tax=Trema orientale TaxID=63057 RepID=A0A2P5FBK0_TREOI|nr:Ulp1 protease family, C-terminal catalytic domain containing protein [Trema orientale]